MKLNNKILLEAIQRGINLAIDDFDDDMNIEAQKVGQIKHSMNTRELIKYRHFVDLGLPSGTLWAKYNLGVDPTNLDKAKAWYGNYYAWGEIEPKKEYSFETYKYGNEEDDTLSKYCNYSYSMLYGVADNLIELLPEDDAAILNDPRNYGWKMPSKEQFEELINHTTSKWVPNYNGVKLLDGILRTASNGNSIFFPASGYRENLLLEDGKWRGFYWSSTLYNIPDKVNIFDFGRSGQAYISNINRYLGCSIRPILN